MRKAYHLIFGRDPSDVEVRAGLDYLRAEPMREYEEKKNAKAAKDAKDSKDTKDVAIKKSDESDKPDAEDAEAEPKSDGMMAGVVPGAGKSDGKKKLLPVTPWGRYLKVLLSSSEFLFVS